ncbi:hypothetical protein QVD17_00150 [Tagetes erecta]|uniref:Uncharacterized protein n=1 Tax=Tagetes erecta TaxID=13708 RepID=A0AAD8LB23_TARER|nr:hypothetical protein QVD17_00150 [Tagetes erecta]
MYDLSCFTNAFKHLLKSVLEDSIDAEEDEYEIQHDIYRCDEGQEISAGTSSVAEIYQHFPNLYESITGGFIKIKKSQDSSKLKTSLVMLKEFASGTIHGRIFAGGTIHGRIFAVGTIRRWYNLQAHSPVVQFAVGLYAEQISAAPRKLNQTKEIDDLCDEWVPESLIPPVIEEMKREVPVLLRCLSLSLYSLDTKIDMYTYTNSIHRLIDIICDIHLYVGPKC